MDRRTSAGVHRDVTRPRWAEAMNLRTSTRSMVVLGTASLLLGGAVVGSVATAERDLSRHGGAARLSGDRDQGRQEGHRRWPPRQRHPHHRRRDGRLGDHERPQLRPRRGGHVPRPGPPPADRPVHDVLAHQGRQARLRAGLRRHRLGVGHRHEDLRQRGQRRHRRQAAEDAAGAGEEGRLQDRQRLHRRDPGRDAGRAGRARHGAQLLRADGHHRTCPTNAKENGGAGSITEQLLDTRPDVTLGGGATTFDETATAGRWQGRPCASRRSSAATASSRTARRWRR